MDDDRRDSISDTTGGDHALRGGSADWQSLPIGLRLVREEAEAGG